MDAGAIIALAALVVLFAGGISAAVWKVCTAISAIKDDLGAQIQTGNAEIHRRIDQVVLEQSHLRSDMARAEARCKERHAA
jgi:hypothetical protein